MPLKLACPNCKADVRLSEPYPLPGATVQCSACARSVAVTYPSGVMDQLRTRGKAFAEEAPGAFPVRTREAMGVRTTRGGGQQHPAAQPQATQATELFEKHNPTDAATEAAGQDARSAVINDFASLADGSPTAVDQTQIAPEQSVGFQELDRTVPSMRSPYGGLPNNIAEPEGRLSSLPGVEGDPTSQYSEARAASDSLGSAAPKKPSAAHRDTNDDGTRSKAGGDTMPKAGAAPGKKQRKSARAADAPPAKRGRKGIIAGTLGCFGSMGMAGIGGTIGVGLLAILGGAAGGYWYFSQDLPTIEKLRAYEPPTVTVVTDHEGKLIGEIFDQKRYVVPIDEIPDHVKSAFMAAEDANFYGHGGIDYMGILRAVARNAAAGKSAQGASTITQQVARNFLLTRDKKITRKIKEVLLSWRIEDAYTKDHILFLYLNEIFLGSQSYGVEAASQTYFGKSVRNISVAEAAILAGLPQRPSDYSPHGNWKQARGRQTYVLRQMLEKGFLSQAEHDAALAEEIVVAPKTNTFRDTAPWFTEHVRRHLVNAYGEEVVTNGGLQVKTTCDLGLQTLAQSIVTDGVHETDRHLGWRRQAVKNVGKGGIDAQRKKDEEEMRKAWMNEKDPSGRTPLPAESELVPGREYDAVIVQVEPKWARVGIGVHDGVVPLAWSTWVYEPNPRMSWSSRSASDLTALVDTDDDKKKDAPILQAGDVVRVKVRALSTTDAANGKAFVGTPGETTTSVAVELVQNPEVESALLSMDLETGAIRAMVGGSDFTESQFNRTIQARRQVGSTMKPIVYAAAISSRKVTSASVFLDGPLAMATSNDFVWKPSNYSNDFEGPMTVRRALAMSKNTVTVRLVEAADPGMNDDLIHDFARALGIGGVPTYRWPADEVPTPKTDVLCPWTKEEPDSTICMDRYPAKDPALTDSEHRRQLKPGDTYWCRACDMSMSLGSASLTMEEMIRAYGVFANGGKLVEPFTVLEVKDRHGKILEQHQSVEPPQVIDPAVASIATWLMEGVVTGGTAARASGELGLKGLAGKTGTTNDEKDAWFVGYTPNVITAVWTGYDDPKSLGVSSTGGRTSLPLFVDYMKVAAPRSDDREFPMRGELDWANIDETTGYAVTGGGMSYPFLKGTVPENTGGRAGELTLEQLGTEM
jgi:penicillin-binding protein 1A